MRCFVGTACTPYVAAPIISSRSRSPLGIFPLIGLFVLLSLIGEVIDAATGRMERYGPWSFKQVHRKRKLLASDAGQVSELVKQTFQDACEANANQMVTFTNTMLSEVSCHMVRIPLMCCLACRAPAATYKGTRNQNMHFTSLQVVWHHGPEVNIAEGYSLGLQVFHRRGDENENQTSQSQATEAGSTGSPSDRRNAAASTLTSSSSDKTDKKKQGKTANDTNQENTLHSHDRPEVEDFLLWCHTQSKINSGRNVDYPRQGDLHQYVPDCRLISCSIARADFTRFLVIAFYSAAPNQSDRHGVVTAVAPADTDTGTDTGSSGGTIASNSRKGTSRRKKRMRSPVPIRAFKALFPGFGSPPGHTFTNSALLQLSFPAQAGRELFWAKFREATEHVTRAINNASDAARATTQFHLMVGPADEGVEVLVVHDGADAAQGKSTGFKKKGTKATTGSNSAAGHFLPRTLAEPRGSSTCTLL